MLKKRRDFYQNNMIFDFSRKGLSKKMSNSGNCRISQVRVHLKEKAGEIGSKEPHTPTYSQDTVR